MSTDQKPGRSWRAVGLRVMIAGAVVALSAAALQTVSAVDAKDTADQAQGTAGAAVIQKDQALQATEGVCQRPQQDAELSAMCAELEALRRQPDPVLAETVDYDRVERFVTAKLEADPRLSEATLLGMVQEALAADPPVDGKTPTDAQLLTLIRQVYAENPPPAPEPGAPGRNAFCFDNPDDPACQPREGAPGAAGVDGEPPFGWVTHYPDGSQEDCRRADPFDRTQPRYDCVFTPAPEQPEEPTPEEPGGLLPTG